MIDLPDADAPLSEDLSFYGLDRTIRFARLRCTPRQELIERVLDLEALDYEALDAYAFRLTELGLTSPEFKFLAASMTEIARKTETASPEVRAIVDKALLRLVRLLPPALADQFARPYLDHKRKTRRKWAYATLREKRLSRRTTTKLANVFRETGDRAILGLITKTPECVRLLGARFLIDRLNSKDEEHWRGRVLECLLTYDRDEAIALAPKFPWEFTYATGRSGDSSLLPVIQSLFKSNSKSGAFVSIYAWCLGKIGAREEIDVLERFIRKKA
jgi:hypothetical protein